MVHECGKLHVKVLRGRNLSVRGFISSDPYVVLSLGSQKRKTKVKKRNLNPTWNEEFTFDPPTQTNPTPYCSAFLTVEVWDKDHFSSDDFMGGGSIDLAPIFYGTEDSLVKHDIEVDADGKRFQEVGEKLMPLLQKRGIDKESTAETELGTLHLFLQFKPKNKPRC